jgi:hypothetical protein
VSQHCWFCVTLFNVLLHTFQISLVDLLDLVLLLWHGKWNFYCFNNIVFPLLKFNFTHCFFLCITGCSKHIQIYIVIFVTLGIPFWQYFMIYIDKDRAIFFLMAPHSKRKEFLFISIVNKGMCLGNTVAIISTPLDVLSRTRRCNRFNTLVTTHECRIQTYFQLIRFRTR